MVTKLSRLLLLTPILSRRLLTALSILLLLPLTVLLLPLLIRPLLLLLSNQITSESKTDKGRRTLSPAVFLCLNAKCQHLNRRFINSIMLVDATANEPDDCAPRIGECQLATLLKDVQFAVGQIVAYQP